jgi:hypothetical protein
MLVRRCLMMGGGAALAGTVLLAFGVPGAFLLLLAPVLVCLATHLLMVQGDPDGRDLLATAQRAIRPPQE